MPHLLLFARKFDIASDDLFLPFLFLAALHSTLFILYFVALYYSLSLSLTTCSYYLNLYIYVGIVSSTLFVLCDTLIAFTSLLGTVSNEKPRRHIGKFLYVHITLVFLESLLQVFGLLTIYSLALPCQFPSGSKQFQILLIVLNSISLILLAIWYSVSFPLAIRSRSRKLNFDSVAEQNQSLADQRNAQKHKKYRTCLLFCCYGHRQVIRSHSRKHSTLNSRPDSVATEVLQQSGQEEEDVLTDIARIMSNFFENVDLVPSDFLVGIILLRRRQLEQRKLSAAQPVSAEDLVVENIEAAGSSENLIEKTTQVNIRMSPISRKASLAKRASRLPGDELEDVKHFYQYAESIYGLPLYLFSNIADGNFEAFAKPFRPRLRNPNRNQTAQTQDNVTVSVSEFVRTHYVSPGWPFCFLPSKRSDIPLTINRVNEFVIRNMNAKNLTITDDLSNVDGLVYLSLQNTLYKPPFMVALDFDKKKIVVAVRGTLSSIDLLVDLHCEVVKIDFEDEDGAESRSDEYVELHTHAGMWKTAKYVCKEIMDAKVFETLYDAHSSFKDFGILCCGHSLGGGVASLLAYLLRTRHTFHNTTCIAYSPPGCMVSQMVYPPVPPPSHSNSFIHAANPSIPTSSSQPAIAPFETFCTSVVLGSDLIPRLSLHSVYELMELILEEIKHCNEPKLGVLSGVVVDGLPLFCTDRLKKFGAKVLQLPLIKRWIKYAGWNEANVERGLEFAEEDFVDENDVLLRASLDLRGTAKRKFVGMLDVPTTYLPGKIVYFERKRIESSLENRFQQQFECVPRYADQREFQEVLISSKMFLDHLPNHLGKILKK